MKNKSFILLRAALFAATIPLHAVNSELSIRISDNSKFTLNVDDYTFGTPSTVYNVTNLTPGMHHVQMFRPVAQTYGHCGLPVMLYDGWLNIPADSRVSAVNSEMGVLNILSVVSLVANGYPYGGYGNGNWGYGNSGYGYENNGYGPSTGSGGGYGGYGGGYGNYGAWYPPPPPPILGMPEADFNALKESIKTKSFESSKATLAAQALQSNKMTSRQIAELVALMDYESTRLELAKRAYAKAVDRNNYYLVNNAFDYESSIAELAEYVNSYQG